MNYPPPAFATVVHMLKAAAGQNPLAEALVLDQERLNYRQYLSCVSAVAGELREIGVLGERVALILPNGPDICIAIYGALAAGGQCTPLNPLYSARELREILADAQPKVLFYDSSQSTVLRPLAAETGIKHIVELGQGARSLTQWRDAGLNLPEPLPQAGDLAMLQYTGGTTGRAKGVNLSHRATAVNVSQREGLLPTRRGRERIVCAMPLFHAYALAMGLHLASFCQGSLIIRPRYHPADLLQAIEREKITLFPGSPTLFTGLMRHEYFADTDFASVHACYSGSAPLSEEVLQRWQDAVQAPVYEGYGQTEAGPVLTFNPVNPAHGVCKPGSVGIAVADTEIQIVDNDTGTRVLPVGEVGEIRVRGPQVMQGYRNLPDETARVLRDGWLYTGDIGELDADAYLYIRDRKKDMVIVGGYNVYPREVDDVLFMHPDIIDAAAVGAPDAYRGEVIRAYVVLRADASANTDEIARHCAQNLAKYKCPVSIEIVDALPKTTVNKTDKNALRERARRRGSTPQGGIA